MPGSSTPVTVTSRLEVLAATAGHAWAFLSCPARPEFAAVTKGAAVWLNSTDHGPVLSAAGPPAVVAGMVATVRGDIPDTVTATLPRGTAELLAPPLSMPAGTDWDHRWTVTPPRFQPGEDAVRPVTDETAVKELLAAASPTASAQPGDERVRRWFGIADARGDLVACAADVSLVVPRDAPRIGLGVLASVATRPAAREHGHAAAVCAALVRALFAQGMRHVALGLYAGNTPAVRLYDRLGFSGVAPFTSGRLAVR